MAVLGSLRAGQVLELGQRRCTLGQFRLYVRNEGPNHHTDAAEAARAGLPRPLAPGPMLMAFLYDVLTNVYGPAWFSTGRLHVAFLKPVYAGDVCELRATVESVGGGELRLQVRIETADGTTVVGGTARGAYPGAGL
jgi:acyl dehydratase